MSSLIAILRRAGGLTARTSHRRLTFTEPPAEPACSWRASDFYEADPYQERFLALEELPEQLYPGKTALLGAWEALQDDRLEGAGLLAALLLIQAETVLDPDAKGAALPDTFQPPRPAPQPTEAHPRGYRGGPHRPLPRPKRPRRELHRACCNAAQLARLVAQLEPHRAAALRLLYCRAPAVAQRIRRGRRDPVARLGSSLPPGFISGFLWQLRGVYLAELRQALTGYSRLALAGSAPLARAVRRLFARTGVVQANAWINLAAALDPDLRLHLLELALESGAAECVPGPLPSAQLLQVVDLSRRMVLRHRLFFALRWVHRVPTLSLLLDGFSLANHADEAHTFTAEPATLSDTEVTLLYLREQLLVQADYSLDDWTLLRLWEDCARFGGLLPLLERLACTTGPLRLAYLLLDDLLDLAREEPACWPTLREELPCWLDLVSGCTAEEVQDLRDVLSVTVGVWDRPGELAIALPRLRSVQRVVSEAELPAGGRVMKVLIRFLQTGAGVWRQALATPRSSLHAVDAAVRRVNDRNLTAYGLHALVDVVPELAVRWLHHVPEGLLAAAKRLGLLRDPDRRRAVVRSFKQHPLVALDPSTSDLADLVQTLDELGAARVQSWIPRRLRQHVRGNIVLRSTQLECHRQRLCARWGKLQLALLSELVMGDLSRGFTLEPDDPRHRHALMILPGLEGNRRAFCRLLRTHAAGAPQPPERHPQNRRWLAGLRRIRGDAWLRGITRSRDFPGSHSVVLCMERDPLEALRLGTLVGSCLGLGGMYAAAAAAVVLDANKQVVFARTRAGEFLARQVLMITREEELACFPVYPDLEDEALHNLFMEYDQHLATAIGTTIYTTDDDPDIPVLLARENYQDDAIDPSAFA